jgi:hypothetical protein
MNPKYEAQCMSSKHKLQSMNPKHEAQNMNFKVTLQSKLHGQFRGWILLAEMIVSSLEHLLLQEELFDIFSLAIAYKYSRRKHLRCIHIRSHQSECLAAFYRKLEHRQSL